MDRGHLHYQGSQLLLLKELLSEFGGILPTSRILIRTSEGRDLERILKYGTDRGGYTTGKMWRFNREAGKTLTHEEVIFATTPEENIQAQKDPDASCSLKKIDLIDDPLLLIYDAEGLEKVWDRQYSFTPSRSPNESLAAIYHVRKVSPVQGWFEDEDGLCYRDLAARIQNGTLVEIGSWKGLSTSYLAGVCRRNGCELYCVDWWNKGSNDDYDHRYKALSRNGDVEYAFDSNMANLDFSPSKLSCSSLEAAQKFGAGDLDMVFLDGSHDYQSVANDLRAWYPKIKPGGILSGHDYKDKHQDLRIAVDEFAHENRCKLERGGESIWWIGLRS